MARYNFTIHGKTKWGISPSATYMVAYCANDSDAEALASILNQNLANYAKVSVSKVVMEAPSDLVPDSPSLTDVAVMGFSLSPAYGSSQRYNFKLPLALASNGEVTGASAVRDALKQYAKTPSGGALSIVVGETISSKNVIVGGGLDV